VLYERLCPIRHCPVSRNVVDLPGMSCRFVIAVLIEDRVGILRDVTTAVSDLGANIDDISQTVLDHTFSVILTATFDAPQSMDNIRSAIAARLEKDAAEISVRPLRRPAGETTPSRGDRFMVTVTGHDRPGILKCVMTFLADKQINVEDWNVLRDGDAITYVGEVTVPTHLDIKQLQVDFQALVEPLALTSCIQHENIFRATNEVGTIRELL